MTKEGRAWAWCNSYTFLAVATPDEQEEIQPRAPRS